MTTRTLDELIAPAPPYRMTRPVATAVAAPSDFRNDSLQKGLEQIRREMPPPVAEKPKPVEVMPAPEKTEREKIAEAADGVERILRPEIEASNPELKTIGDTARGLVARAKGTWTPKEVARASQVVQEVIAKGGKVVELPGGKTFAVTPAEGGGERARQLEDTPKVAEARDRDEADMERAANEGMTGKPAEVLPSVGSERVYMKAIQPPAQEPPMPKPTAEIDVLDVLREAQGSKPEETGQLKKQEDFHITFEEPSHPLREAPKLDNLAAVEQFLESSRRTGRSPEFIRGLEKLRREFVQKSERPRPEPDSERVSIRPGTEPDPELERLRPSGESVRPEEAGRQKGLTTAERAQSEVIAKLQQRIAQLESQIIRPKKIQEQQAQRQEPGPSTEQSEQSEEKGPASKALEELGMDDIEKLGDSTEPGWWERIGIGLEGSMHDVLAWYSGVLAKRAKDNLAERVKKRKRMEEVAKKLADKSWLGAVASPLRYGPRIQYQRWREGITRAALERNDDNRAWHENARNELVSLAADRFDVPLKTYEARAEKYTEKSEQYEADLEVHLADIEKWRKFFVITKNPREKEIARMRIEAHREKYEDVVKQKEEAERLWQNENKNAIRIQRIKNQLLSAAKPADRPNTEHEPRLIEKGRQKRHKPVSSGKFRNIKNPGTEETAA